MKMATTDMTEGKPLRLIVSFALPMLLGNVCQQLYSVIDSLVVGKIIGVNAFAALGAAGFYYWLIFGIVLGFTQGFGTYFAQRFGAKDFVSLKRGVGLSITLSAVFGILLTVICLVFIRPVLVLVKTPPEILDDACLYLYWVLSATFVLFAYNTAAALLRALGNSKTPLIGVIIASIINIALDLIFVGVFHMGVEGVAIATVIAMICSFAYCIKELLKIEFVHVTRNELKFERSTFRELMRLGSPLAFRNMLISIGSLIVQYVINGYGTLYVAGISAANKYFGVMDLVGSSMDGAVAVFVGQNYGAMRLDRIKDGMRTARRIAIISSVAVSALVLIFGREMVAFLVTGSADEVAAVVEIGYNNLTAIALCLPFLYYLFIFRSALQGMGNSSIPMLSGFLETIMRMASVLLLPMAAGIWGVYFADGVAWIGASILLAISYFAVYKNRVQSRAWQELK